MIEKMHQPLGRCCNIQLIINSFSAIIYILFPGIHQSLILVRFHDIF